MIWDWGYRWLELEIPPSLGRHERMQWPTKIRKKCDHNLQLCTAVLDLNYKNVAIKIVFIEIFKESNFFPNKITKNEQPKNGFCLHMLWLLRLKATFFITILDSFDFYRSVIFANTVSRKAKYSKERIKGLRTFLFRFFLFCFTFLENPPSSFAYPMRIRKVWM